MGSVWGLLVGRPPLVAFLPLRQQKGEGTCSCLFFALLCSFCVTSLDKCLGGPAPPTPSPHVLVPTKYTQQQPDKVHAGELQTVS